MLRAFRAHFCIRDFQSNVTNAAGSVNVTAFGSGFNQLSNEPAFAAVKFSRCRREVEADEEGVGEVRPFYNGDEAGEQTESRVGRLCPGKKARPPGTSATSNQIRKYPKICGLSEAVVTSKSRPALKSEIWGSAARFEPSNTDVAAMGRTR
jgi:hypothetical protein